MEGAAEVKLQRFTTTTATTEKHRSTTVTDEQYEHQNQSARCRCHAVFVLTKTYIFNKIPEHRRIFLTQTLSHF